MVEAIPGVILLGNAPYHPELIEKLEESGYKVHVNSLKAFESEQSLNSWLEQVFNQLSEINGLVFTDAIRVPEKLNEPEFLVAETVAVCQELFITIKQLIPKMVKKKQTLQIVVVVDISAVMGRADFLVSSTIGGALIGMAKSLAKELGRYGLYINVLALGPVNGYCTEPAYNHAEKKMFNLLMQGRRVEIVHLANNCLFLLKGENHINGQVIQVSDGIIM